MRILTDSSRRLAAVFAVSCGLIAMAAPVASAASADYDNGLRLGSQAYEYGFPLTEMERIYRTAISVNVPDAVAHGPANKFAHIRNIADASQRTVNAPNNDTPYSLAWLDLSKEPMVLHAPAIKKRFWEFELVDPYTNNFYNITSAQKRMGRGDLGSPRVVTGRSSVRTSTESCRAASSESRRPMTGSGSSGGPT